jgi:hypothetical protein
LAETVEFFNLVLELKLDEREKADLLAFLYVLLSNATRATQTRWLARAPVSEGVLARITWMRVNALQSVSL